MNERRAFLLRAYFAGRTERKRPCDSCGECTCTRLASRRNHGDVQGGHDRHRQKTMTQPPNIGPAATSHRRPCQCSAVSELNPNRAWSNACGGSDSMPSGRRRLSNNQRVPLGLRTPVLHPKRVLPGNTQSWVYTFRAQARANRLPLPVCDTPSSIWTNTTVRSRLNGPESHGSWHMTADPAFT